MKNILATIALGAMILSGTVVQAATCSPELFKSYVIRCNEADQSHDDISAVVWCQQGMEEAGVCALERPDPRGMATYYKSVMAFYLSAAYVREHDIENARFYLGRSQEAARRALSFPLDKSHKDLMREIIARRY